MHFSESRTCLNLAKPNLQIRLVSCREGDPIAVSSYPLQAPVVVSMIALLCSTSPNREAYFSRSSSSVVG